MSISDYYVPGGTCRNCGHTAASCRCPAFNVQQSAQGAAGDIINAQQLQGFALPEMPDLVELQRVANRAHFVEAITKCLHERAVADLVHDIIKRYDEHYPEPAVSKAYGCTGCGFAFESKKKPKLCPDCGKADTLARDPGNDRR